MDKKTCFNRKGNLFTELQQGDEKHWFGMKTKSKTKTITKTEKKGNLLIELQGRDKVKRPTLVVSDQHLLSQRGHLDKNQHRVDQKRKRDFVQQSLFCESVLFEVRYFTHFLK